MAPDMNVRRKRRGSSRPGRDARRKQDDATKQVILWVVIAIIVIVIIGWKIERHYRRQRVLREIDDMIQRQLQGR